MFEFDADNLIYNRFDLIYDNVNVERFSYNDNGVTYAIDAHYENNRAVINTWGKRFPQRIYESVIDDIFDQHPEIRCIEMTRTGNDYKHLLNEINDIRVPVPKTVEELLQRLKGKHQYTLKRIKRIMNEKYGPLAITVYGSDIPDALVNLYFEWKFITHGTDYAMSPKEYLIKYYVTNAIMIKAGNENVGVAFFCIVENIAYLENFSYNSKLNNLSPGYLTYELLLEELVKRRCLYLYLGGGEYSYKKRFGAEVSLAYSGTVYSPSVFEKLNSYFKNHNINRIAVYGVGAGGQEFMKLANCLAVEITYCIDKDKNKKEIDNLPIYSLEDKFEDVDAVIITLKTHNKEVENFIESKFKMFFYWKDLVNGNF